MTRQLCEDAVDDLSLVLKIKERAGGLVEVTVWSSIAEEVIGLIRAAWDAKARLLRIEEARLDQDFQGRGVGPAAYVRLDRWAQEKRGFRLASDLSRTGQAQKVWDRFVSRGMAREVPFPGSSSKFYVMEVSRMSKKSKRPNPIKGGVGDRLRPKDVSRHELALGVEDEKEHSSDPVVAADIAFDHLAQDPDYYSGMSESVWPVLEWILRG